MIGKAVNAILLSDGILAELVRYTEPASGPGAGRIRHGIYPRRAPQGKPLPYIVYTRVSTNRLHHLGGPSGLTAPRVQIDCYARTYEAADRLADRARLVLDGFRGVAAGLFVQSVVVGDDQDLGEDSVHADDEPPERVSFDATIHFDEPIARGEGL